MRTWFFVNRKDVNAKRLCVLAESLINETSVEEVKIIVEQIEGTTKLLRGLVEQAEKDMGEKV